MSFMPDTYMVCEDCNGLRYGQELLELHWRGKNIADTLNMTFDEAAEFFSFHTQLQETMQLMVETGLGSICNQVFRLMTGLASELQDKSDDKLRLRVPPSIMCAHACEKHQTAPVVKIVS